MRIITDYQIIKSQTPLWEKNTEYIDYIPFWGSKYAFAKSHIVRTLRVFWRRRHYDLVITGDFRGSMLYAFLQCIFTWHKRPQLMLDFMLDERKPGLIWCMKRGIQKCILRKVDCILIFSRNELEDYSKLLKIPKEKFKFLYYHTNITDPHMINEHKGYVFAAGKAGRDYATLLKALEGTDIPLVIVTTPERMRGLTPPPTVKVFYNISYDKYLSLLTDAQVVVVPLKSRVRSVGMVVMLEGMAYGKPVITTMASSNQEYIKDGENGFLVEVEDADTLRERILYLRANPSEACKIGERGLEDVKNNWLFEHYVRNVLDIAKEMVEKK